MTAYQPASGRNTVSRYAGPASSSLAEVLERVLDRGVVIVGDIVVGVLDIELLTLKVRLLIASADTAKQMGIDWWVADPFLNSRAAREQSRVEAENRELRSRLAELERRFDRAELDPADSGRPDRDGRRGHRDGRGHDRDALGRHRDGRGHDRDGIERDDRDGEDLDDRRRERA